MATIRSVNRRHNRAIVALLARTKAAERAVIEAVKPVKAAS